MLGAKVDFEDAKSLKGSLGARFGRVLNKSEGAIVTASLTAKVWNEFLGDNKTNFNFAAQTCGDFGGAYGDVGGNCEVTGIKFKSDYKESSIKVGARWTF